MIVDPAGLGMSINGDVDMSGGGRLVNTGYNLLFVLVAAVLVMGSSLRRLFLNI